MKTTNLVGKFATIAAIALLGFISSCKDEETVNLQDISDASSESLADSYYQDADDLSLYTIDNKSSAGGRVASDDYRITCATIIAEGTAETGVVSVDFGTGCTDSKGNVRKGKINLAYSGGPAGTIGFSVTETFTDYYVNGIKLEGSRVITRVEASTQANIKHHIVLTDGKATWPDATFATRSADLYREFDAAAGTITITGSASGTGRKGKTYAMSIAEDVIHKLSCIADGIYMAVDGKKVFTIDGTKQITIEYGDGTCDKVVTVTINGLTKNVTIGKN
jgi:hypothetical protein